MIATSAADGDAGCGRTTLASSARLRSAFRLLPIAAAILFAGACATLPGHKPPAHASSSAHVPAAHKPAPRPPATDAQGEKNARDAVPPASKNALAPSEIGYYMDVLQGRLRQVGSQGMTRVGDRIAINLSGRLPFAPGSSQVSAGVRGVLAPLAQVLVEYRKTRISVHFRRDDSGAQANHPRVNELRAQAVTHYLSEAGVAGNRISMTGSTAANTQDMQIVIEPIIGGGGAH